MVGEAGCRDEREEDDGEEDDDRAGLERTVVPAGVGNGEGPGGWGGSCV